MYAVFDLETTGLFNKDRIVEVAIVHLDADGNMTDQWATLVNPQRDLGPQTLHGIRSADVRRAPTFAQIAGEILARLAGRIPVAHNLAFDSRMLTHECLRMGLEIPQLHEHGVCTMSWAAHFLPGVQRTLGHCCEAAGIGNDRPHEALSDTLATAELLSFYLGSTSVIPPWAGLHEIAGRLEWPSAPVGGAEPVTRGAGASDGTDFLARLVEHLPRVPSPPQADMYLSVLDRALVDRHVSATEADELVRLASDMGISRQAAIELHRGYLRALAAAALEDGIVTDAERDDLLRVAGLLSLQPEDVAEALRSAPEAAIGTPTFVLRKGDTVVLTGSFPQSKQYWADRVASAGLRVAANVTKKTALVIAADPDTMSGKATKARQYRIPVVGVEAVDLVLARLD